MTTHKKELVGVFFSFFCKLCLLPILSFPSLFKDLFLISIIIPPKLAHASYWDLCSFGVWLRHGLGYLSLLVVVTGGLVYGLSFLVYGRT